MAHTEAIPTPPVWGVMAEFPDITSIYKAAHEVRDAGFTKWDVYSPVPIHGMSEAMGLKLSRITFIIGAGATTGVLGAIALQIGISAYEYQTVVGGKPFAAWEPFTPIIFELGVLLSAFGAVFGMLALNKLPMLYHPLHKKERFLRVSDDRFVLAIEADDPNYDASATGAMLKKLGATHVDVVEA
ncbi:MAG: DUF3341 domain-containing protein [Phycisphaerales bacterium]|nr:DUF3341 domain-containing protein [Phycisphaerales bacterium]